jgi:glycosyltransferase involved in cell wall biosynthesis
MAVWNHAQSVADTTGETSLEFVSADQQGRLSMCLVGPGWRFTSGISYYTCRLAKAAANSCDVSVIQLRQLLPRFLYPGRQRVGQPRARMTYPTNVPVFDGVNWWWGVSFLRALSFMRSKKPDFLVLQWWTATTLHTYLALGVVARLLGARVVIEMHETQDPGEASYSIIRLYCRWGLGLLLRLCHGCVVHSMVDMAWIEKSYDTSDICLTVARHGPYDQFNAIDGVSVGNTNAAIASVKKAPRPEVTNILFFGLIRPYKGLQDLLMVFNDLPREDVDSLWLTVVGETWSGYTQPRFLIENSPHRDHITFINEYVSDEVVAAAFSHADIVVLPYHRSSGSGALQVAMSWGIPVVVSRVGGLPEAAADYAGAIFVSPHDHEALKAGIRSAVKMVGQRFADPRSWDEMVNALVHVADITPLRARIMSSRD